MLKLRQVNILTHILQNVAAEDQRISFEGFANSSSDLGCKGCNDGA
jgi:hypothetical protein